MQVGDDTFLVDVTLGIAVYPTHADDGASLFRRAELALNDARENELAFDLYRPDATQQQAALWKLESDLDKAISTGALEVHYQPKIHVESNQVIGAEALVRWRTASGRFVPPDEFIPLAERSGSIVPLTWLVFQCAEERAPQLAELGPPFSVAINVSPQVLVHPEFYPRLTTLTQRLGVHGLTVTIELTEDSLLHSDSVTVAALHKLRQLGVSLAIDDFGKGYSSLSYLKNVPANEIKIDKRFVGTLSVDRKDREIVKAVVDLGARTRHGVVAEGVDSAESLRGCSLARLRDGTGLLHWPPDAGGQRRRMGSKLWHRSAPDPEHDPARRRALDEPAFPGASRQRLQCQPSTAAADRNGFVARSRLSPGAARQPAPASVSEARCGGTPADRFEARSWPA